MGRQTRVVMVVVILLGPSGASSVCYAEAAVFHGKDRQETTPEKGSTRSSEAAPRPGESLFHCDFDSAEWFKEWGLATTPKRVDQVSDDSKRGFEPLRGKALRVRIDSGGHYGLSMAFAFKKRLGYEPEEVYFRYYLRLADDWDPRRGGKLPGFGGTYGRAGWGGRPVNGRDGWSARGLFLGQKEGRTPIGFYCYHMDMKGRYGSNWVWDRDELGLLENNRWYCIEQYLKLNAPGRPNGILRGWVDGKLAFENRNVRMRAVDTLKLESVWINFYLGGTWTAERDHHVFVDEVVISKRPIGPLVALDTIGSEP
ncbi:polysaccharide lyase [Planctomycetota bacterium]